MKCPYCDQEINGIFCTSCNKQIVCTICDQIIMPGEEILAGGVCEECAEEADCQDFESKD